MPVWGWPGLWGRLAAHSPGWSSKAFQRHWICEETVGLSEHILILLALYGDAWKVNSGSGVWCSSCSTWLLRGSFPCLCWRMGRLGREGSQTLASSHAAWIRSILLIHPAQHDLSAISAYPEKHWGLSPIFNPTNPFGCLQTSLKHAPELSGSPQGKCSTLDSPSPEAVMYLCVGGIF